MRLLVTMALGLACAPAHAHGCRSDEPGSERFGFFIGVGRLGIGTGMAIGARFLPQSEGEVWTPPIDQGVPEVLDPAAQSTSDTLLGLGFGLGAAGILTATLRCGPEGTTGYAWATPLVDGLGTFALVWGTTDLVKRTTGRPRPYTRSGLSLDPQDDFASLPSGHTSMATWGFTHGTSEILRLTDLPPWGRALVGVGVGSAGGLVTGWQRVEAGKHHWSDVLAGWSIGLIIASLPTLTDPLFEKVARDNRKVALGGLVTAEGAQLGVAGVW